MIYTVFATVLCVLLRRQLAFVAWNRTRLNRLLDPFLVIGIAMPVTTSSSRR